MIRLEILTKSPKSCNVLSNYLKFRQYVLESLMAKKIELYKVTSKKHLRVLILTKIVSANIHNKIYNFESKIFKLAFF